QDVILSMNEGHDRSRLAFDVYSHRLAREVGGMLASLGGMDALVFTGGVGENSPLVREKLCQRFSFLGMKLNGEQNWRSPPDEDIAAVDSTIRVIIVKAEEELEIARECWNRSRASDNSRSGSS
ncbi:MAG: acetate kinase, partial [Bryobacteraceae bacterium]